MTPSSAGAGPQELLLLSPHLDDAVFSAWHLLTGDAPVTVATIFAGVPAEGVLTPLDREHGATGSAAWVRRRRAEDAAVLDSVGAASAHLDLLDVQYRAERVPHVRAALADGVGSFVTIVEGEPDLRVGEDEIEAAVTALGSLGRVAAPLGVGGHPDHVAVARFAARLAREGADVTFWADAPYFLRSGLPSCVTGVANDDADALLARALDDLGLAPRPRPDVVLLSPEQVAHKAAATRGYVTELPWIVADFGAPATDRAALRIELYWRVGER